MLNFLRSHHLAFVTALLLTFLTTACLDKEEEDDDTAPVTLIGKWKAIKAYSDRSGQGVWADIEKDNVTWTFDNNGMIKIEIPAYPDKTDTLVYSYNEAKKEIEVNFSHNRGSGVYKITTFTATDLAFEMNKNNENEKWVLKKVK